MTDLAGEGGLDLQSSTSSNAYKDKVAALLATADIEVNGSRPWDLCVENDDMFARVIGNGSLGLGESYMDGWWNCQQLDEMFNRLLSADLASQVTTLADRWFFLKGHLRNRQIGRRLRETAASHYDIGNDLYQKMLDPRMIYTCGYWQDAQDLTQAQEHKLTLVAKKLQLQPGMRILDIGCGWGGSAAYMAEKFGVTVVGISLSAQQIDYAIEQYSSANLEFRLQDFRGMNEQFDRIYSLGMFEHVGFKNYRDYFSMVDRCLVDTGLFLLHTIGHRVTSHRVDPWIDRYIFPNSILPSAELICRTSANVLTIQDWHNFGLDYHRTLLEWSHNVTKAWPELPNYDPRFQRMWHYFLLCSAGAFKAQRNHLWQVVFAKGKLPQPYQAVRTAL